MLYLVISVVGIVLGCFVGLVLGAQLARAELREARSLAAQLPGHSSTEPVGLSDDAPAPSHFGGR